MFLELGQSLDECAEKYRRFCNNYKPKSKTAHARKSSWGNRFLPQLRKGSKPTSPLQRRIPWHPSIEKEPTILEEVVQLFRRANAYNPFKPLFCGVG